MKHKIIWLEIILKSLGEIFLILGALFIGVFILNFKSVKDELLISGMLLFIYGIVSVILGVMIKAGVEKFYS